MLSTTEIRRLIQDQPWTYRSEVGFVRESRIPFASLPKWIHFLSASLQDVKLTKGSWALVVGTDHYDIELCLASSDFATLVEAIEAVETELVVLSSLF